MSEKWEIEKGYPLCCRAIINLCPLRISPISLHLNHYLFPLHCNLFICVQYYFGSLIVHTRQKKWSILSTSAHAFSLSLSYLCLPFFPSSLDFQSCYMHAVKLLSSLSGFQVTRKAWRKEAFDLFLDPSFFAVELEALREWKVVIDNLMTQDQVTFRDLLTRLNTSAATNVVNIFSSLEQVHTYIIHNNIIIRVW